VSRTGIKRLLVASDSQQLCVVSFPDRKAA